MTIDLKMKFLNFFGNLGMTILDRLHPRKSTLEITDSRSVLKSRLFFTKMMVLKSRLSLFRKA